ncbi:ParB/RepB/Spo0J family partition protein [Sedimentisphaera salicampi]|uniref:Putative chromosome-partitioning protein ParB n=1 Tax=Sedimentisphaera salicampi TaxID=1941349 RepID=A0A1W6LMN4_9BACT|nr:ParB/RepB/Spo0J family partition protein [Sedimentisphaera salicampi]ARN57039.1 putative chromosome-partitioning protein ParB [Sedimentisphaera salicampi]
MAKTTKSTKTKKTSAAKKKTAAKKKSSKHLGRGLQSLMTPAQQQAAKQEASENGEFRELKLGEISPNPYQPRTEWDEQELTKLVDSIKANGIVQPIVVKKVSRGYQLIAGERRWRAAKLAGNKTIPSIIKEASDEQMLEMALIENIHRSDLNPIERANAYKEYTDNFGLSQTQVAERLGENRSVVANHIRLLELPQEVKEMLVNNALSMGQARALLALPDENLQKKLAYRAMTGRLTVREVERLVKKQIDSLENPEQSSENIEDAKSAHIADLESRIRESLGTKVKIKTNKTGKKGSITIDFYSLEEFDRLTNIFGVNLKDQ